MARTKKNPVEPKKETSKADKAQGSAWKKQTQLYQQDFITAFKTPEPATTCIDLSTYPVMLIRTKGKGKGVLAFQENTNSVSLVNMSDGQGFILSVGAARELGKYLSEWATKNENQTHAEFWVAS